MSGPQPVRTARGREDERERNGLNKTPLRTFCAAHPVLIAHLLLFGFAPWICRALTAALPSPAEPLIPYLLTPFWLYLIIRAVNKALSGSCRESTRRGLFVYRIVLIVLLLSMLSFVVIRLSLSLLMLLLPTR